MRNLKYYSSLLNLTLMTRSETYLKSENYGPNETQDETFVSIDDIFGANRLQANLRFKT